MSDVYRLVVPIRSGEQVEITFVDPGAIDQATRFVDAVKAGRYKLQRTTTEEVDLTRLARSE